MSIRVLSKRLRKEGDLMDLKLERKLALVTGSTKGIGKGIAKALLDEGARVIINGRSRKAVDEVVEELSQYGEVYGASGDLATMSGAKEVITSVDEIGDLDVLINNMGIYIATPFEEIDDDEWMKMINTNVLSAIRMCRHYLPKMLKRNSGRIQIIASECGVKPLSAFVHYSVSKTALLGLGRSLAEMTKGSNVTVNTILPGPTWTEGTAIYQNQRGKNEGKTIDEIIQEYFTIYDPSSLIQRFATVEEVANTCVYYCSDLAAATNGAPIRVEGGIIRSI